MPFWEKRNKRINKVRREGERRKERNLGGEEERVEISEEGEEEETRK